MSSSSVSPFLAVTSILVVFFSALLGAILPLRLLATSTRPATLFRYGNAFAAGFLSAAGFVHLLPAGDRAFLRLFPLATYPTAGLLALAGAAAVFALDHVLRHRIAHDSTPDPGGHVEHFHTHPHAKDEEDPLLAPRPPEHPAVHVASSPALAYVLAAALSLHSLVEGLTLGASVLQSSRFMAILAAIVAHKTFAAISLGTSLAGVVATSRGSQSARTAAFATALGFAALTPVGALLGAAAVTSWLDSRESAVVSAALNCLSGGIFIYVAFVELLAEDFRYGEDDQPHGGGKRGEEEADDAVQRALVFVCSAAAMSLLAIWT